MPSNRFKLHAAAYIVLAQDNNVLLARRYNTGYQDGKFGLIAGHLDGDESASMAAIREAKEEIGIDIHAKDLQLLHIMHRSSPDQGKDFEYVDFVFMAKNWQGDPAIMEPNKCDRLEWFDRDHLPDNLTPYLQEVFDLVKQGQPFSEQGWPS